MILAFDRSSINNEFRALTDVLKKINQIKPNITSTPYGSLIVEGRKSDGCGLWSIGLFLNFWNFQKAETMLITRKWQSKNNKMFFKFFLEEVVTIYVHMKQTHSLYEYNETYFIQSTFCYFFEANRSLRSLLTSL